MSRPAFTHARRCQIAIVRPSFGDPSPPKCGKPATWLSDDIGPTTTWMCDLHQEEIARDVDDAEFGKECA